MKQCAALLLLLLCFLLSACSVPEPDGNAEASAIDTSAVSELARQRFHQVFPEAEDRELCEKSVYVRNTDPEHVVIIFHDSLGGERGDYGLEYRGNPKDGYQLLQEGAGVTGALLEPFAVSQTED